MGKKTAPELKIRVEEYYDFLGSNTGWSSDANLEKGLAGFSEAGYVSELRAEVP